MPFEEYERELLSRLALAMLVGGMVLLTAWGVFSGPDAIGLLALLLVGVGVVVEWASGWWRFG